MCAMAVTHAGLFVVDESGDGGDGTHTWSTADERESWAECVLAGLNVMRESNTMCDVILNSADNKLFCVHSAMLGAASLFFRQVLAQSKASGGGIVVRLEKDGSLVTKMVDFLYTGRTSASLEELEELRLMADGYGLDRLARLCAERLYGGTATVLPQSALATATRTTTAASGDTLPSVVDTQTRLGENDSNLSNHLGDNLAENGAEIHFVAEDSNDLIADGSQLLVAEGESHMVAERDSHLTAEAENHHVTETEYCYVEDTGGTNMAVDVASEDVHLYDLVEHIAETGDTQVVFESEVNSLTSHLNGFPELQSRELQQVQAVTDAAGALRVINPYAGTRGRRPGPLTRPAGLTGKKTWRDYRYPCETCGKDFASLTRLRGHEAVHTGERRHVCTLCGARFIQIEYLREHVTMHSDRRPFKCSQCELTFRLMRHLKKHFKVHSSDRPFGCDKCNKTFKRADRLKQHAVVHNGERPYECQQCARTFKIAEALLRHQRAVHHHDCAFMCGFCGSGFRRIKGLDMHLNICKIAVEKRKNECEVCGKLFKTPMTLIRHRRNHAAEESLRDGNLDESCTSQDHHAGVKAESNGNDTVESSADSGNTAVTSYSIQGSTQNTNAAQEVESVSAYPEVIDMGEHGVIHVTYV